jgi:hypothetical protein
MHVRRHLVEFWIGSCEAMEEDITPRLYSTHKSFLKTFLKSILSLPLYAVEGEDDMSAFLC